MSYPELLILAIIVGSVASIGKLIYGPKPLTLRSFIGHAWMGAMVASAGTSIATFWLPPAEWFPHCGVALFCGFTGDRLFVMAFDLLRQGLTAILLRGKDYDKFNQA